MNASSIDTRQKWGRVKIAAIAALFALPIITSTLLYKSGWRPAQSVNHGNLIQPARPVRDAMLTSLTGERIAFSRLPKKWTMLYIAPANCDAACDTALYKMHQVQLAQGEHAERIQRVIVAAKVMKGDALFRALDRYPGGLILTGDDVTVHALADQFGADGQIFLVDPLGNFMMSYPRGADASGMRKDLTRLLKVSQIG